MHMVARVLNAYRRWWRLSTTWQWLHLQDYCRCGGKSEETWCCPTITITHLKWTCKWKNIVSFSNCMYAKYSVTGNVSWALSGSLKRKKNRKKYIYIYIQSNKWRNKEREGNQKQNVTNIYISKQRMIDNKQHVTKKK